MTSKHTLWITLTRGFITVVESFLPSIGFCSELPAKSGHIFFEYASQSALKKRAHSFFITKEGRLEEPIIEGDQTCIWMSNVCKNDLLSCHVTTKKRKLISIRGSDKVAIKKLCACLMIMAQPFIVFFPVTLLSSHQSKPPTPDNK